LNDRITGESCLMVKMIPEVSREVNLAAFDEFAVAAINRGIAERGVLALDELGRFEEPCERFKKAVFDALDSDVIVLGILKLCDTPFVNAIKARADVTVITVTEENRDTITIPL
ncbi:MAG: nucleoside-triphosphatase, partial [Oscillospiraceae bacterium]|nr:nucleoside-triphosphatase [Oscillospiraceae bacterium]